jgi:hypothetical protein
MDHGGLRSSARDRMREQPHRLGLCGLASHLDITMLRDSSENRTLRGVCMQGRSYADEGATSIGKYFNLTLDTINSVQYDRG